MQDVCGCWSRKWQANHGFWSSAGLKMSIYPQCYRPAIWTSKVGQGDLVFDLRPGFASRSICACKITSLCVQRLRLVPPWLSQIDSYILTPCDPEKYVKPQVTLQSASMSGAPKMQIWWQQVPEIPHISVFVIAWKPMKVGQGDLLFLCNQGSLVGHCMQVQRLRFVPPCLSQNLICPFWPFWLRKVGQTPGVCCTHVRYTHDPN